MSKCLDCGEAMIPTITHDLCDECAQVADQIAGSAEKRTQQLKESA